MTNYRFSIYEYNVKREIPTRIRDFNSQSLSDAYNQFTTVIKPPLLKKSPKEVTYLLVGVQQPIVCTKDLTSKDCRAMMALAFRNRYIRLTQASIFDPWVTKGKKYQYHIISKDISSEKVSMSDEKKDWGAAVTKFRELTADHEAKA